MFGVILAVLWSLAAVWLRTNHPSDDPVELWRWYIQLTQAEAAFRTGKTDLLLRPIFHQKTHRVEAHILVCFLSLVLWRSLEQWMRAKGLGDCARQLLIELGLTRSHLTKHDPLPMAPKVSLGRRLRSAEDRRWPVR